jgi:hypothetical protein
MAGIAGQDPGICAHNETEYAVCAFAAVAMNLLRLIGQHTLHEQDSPVRHQAQHARRWVLGPGANDAAFAVFERHWRELDGPTTA